MHDQQPHAATKSTKSEQPGRRVAQAAQWLLEGMRPREVVLKGATVWGIKQRMAQVYVSKAKEQLTLESVTKVYLLEVLVVQDMRVRAIRAINTVVDDPNVDPRVKVAGLGKLTGLLRDYEKAALRVNEVCLSGAPLEALQEARRKIEVLETQDYEDNDAANAAEESAALAAASAASAPAPVPGQPVPEAEAPVPTEPPKAAADETAPALSTLAAELPKPVASATTPSSNGHHAQPDAPAHWPSPLAVAASSCNHTPSDPLAKTHCAGLKPSGNASGPARAARVKQRKPPFRRR